MTWEQTAAALAREVDRLQKENDRLIAFVNEVAHVNAADFSDGWKALVEFARVGRGLLSPAAEGGGAAIGGESKTIAITTTVTEAMRNQWHLAKSGESQALQAAILGLHTLAGEFPTPTWKTREDYLQATISEINEILGKQ